jgi:hypothetical protein
MAIEAPLHLHAHTGTRVLALRQATVLLRTRRLPSGTGRTWSSGARNAEWDDNGFVGTAMAAEAFLYRQHFCEIVTLYRPPPHQDWGRARTAGNRFARNDKEPGPSWGKQLPGERPRETAET